MTATPGRRWLPQSGLVGAEAEVALDARSLDAQCRRALMAASLLFATDRDGAAAQMASSSWDGRLTDDLLAEWAAWDGGGGQEAPGAGEAAAREDDSPRLRERLKALEEPLD